MSTTVLERTMRRGTGIATSASAFLQRLVQCRLAVELSKDERFDVLSNVAVCIDGEVQVPALSVYPKRPVDFRRDMNRMAEMPKITIDFFAGSRVMHDIICDVDADLADGVKSCWVVYPAPRLVTILLPDNNQVFASKGMITNPETRLSADIEALFA